MERDHLEIRANMAALDAAKDKVQDLQNLIEKLKQQQIDLRKRKFSDHYGCCADEVYDEYGIRLAACCGQGGSGYYWWLPGSKRRPAYCHCVVLDYKNAQPSQKELDVYWALFGCDMKIDTVPHTERWGN